MVGMLEDFLPKKDDNSGDVLEKWRREIVGTSARIELPLTDRFILRQIAPMLAGLAEHVAFTCRRTDIDEYQILVSVKNEIAALNRFIRSKHGGANKNGTFPRSKAEQAELERGERRLELYLAQLKRTE